MRNLKRVLSLVLASIMLIGMMVVGASAVDTYNDFSDKDEIVNKDAVSLLVTLDVINGKEDGSYFDPTGDVTRAEMAKMISVILNRGADINNQYATLNNGLTDIANNWAVGHINYCYSLDIIAGRGDGRFDPTANVTAVEAAKMLLSAAGYDASIEGMIGPNWDTNTAGLASRLGIFENFEKDITQPLNRDDAALLIYNFLDIEMIQSYENGYAIAFGDSRTVLSFAYGVIKVQGVVVANEWATVNTADGEDAMKVGTTTLYNRNGIFSTTTNTQTNGGTTGLTTAELALRTGTFKVSTPEEYLGRSVTLYIRKTTILADSIVYGTPVLTDDNIVVETGAQVKGGSRTSSGTLLKLLSNNNLNVNNQTLYFHNYDEVEDPNVNDTDTFFNKKGATLTVIDNDSDGIVDYVLSKEKTLSQVSSYSTKNETLNLRGISGSIDFDKVMGYEDVAKDDIVFFVQYGGRTYVNHPDTVRGEMEMYNVKGTEKYMRVEGEKYEDDGLTVAANTDATKFIVTECENGGVEFDNTYDFYLDDYGNVTAYQIVEGAAAKYALVLNSAFSTNGLTTTAQVRLLLADGTVSLYDLDWAATARKLKDQLNAAGGTSGAATTADIKKIFDGTGNTISGDGDWSTGEVEELLKYMLGTDDGRQGASEKYSPVGYFKGNIVKYTMDDDNKVTITLPELEVGTQVYHGDNSNVWEDGPIPTPSETPASTYWAKHATLDKDLKKGNVDIYVTEYAADGSDITGTDRDLGIDADTVVFYYNGNDSAVRIGYDEMAREIPKDVTHVSVVAYRNYKGETTDVAEAIVLYTDQAQFGSDNYVFVLKELNVYKDGVYYYNAVDAEGNVQVLKSKEDWRPELRALDSDCEGLILAMNTDKDGYAEFESTDDVRGTNRDFNEIVNALGYAGDYSNARVVHGIVEIESNRYINVFTDWDVDSNDVVEAGGAYIRLGLPSGKSFADLTFDMTDSYDEGDKALTTDIANGMLVAVVFDDSQKVVAIYLEEEYKTEDDGPVSEAGKVPTSVDDVDTDGNLIKLHATYGAKNRSDRAAAALEAEGWTINNETTYGSEYQFTATKNGRTKTFTTVTTWYSADVTGSVDLDNSDDAAVEVKKNESYVGNGSELDKVGVDPSEIFDPTDAGPHSGYDQTEQHMVFGYEVATAGTGTLELTISKGRTELYNELWTGVTQTKGHVGSFIVNIQNNSRHTTDGDNYSNDGTNGVFLTWNDAGTGPNENPDTSLGVGAGHPLAAGTYKWEITFANNVVGSGTFTIE